MTTISKNQHITVTVAKSGESKSFVGTAIRADEVLSLYMGQFIVLRLDTPINLIKTMCFRVNGTSHVFKEVVTASEVEETPQPPAAEVYVSVYTRWTSIPGGGYSMVICRDFKEVEIVLDKTDRWEELKREIAFKSMHNSTTANGLHMYGWYE